MKDAGGAEHVVEDCCEHEQQRECDYRASVGGEEWRYEHDAQRCDRGDHGRVLRRAAGDRSGASDNYERDGDREGSAVGQRRCGASRSARHALQGEGEQREERQHEELFHR